MTAPITEAEVERIAWARERMLRDVDPKRVAASRAHKLAFMRGVEALPEPRRCKGGPVNHDGSCFVCGDDQGELSRCLAVRDLKGPGA